MISKVEQLQGIGPEFYFWCPGCNQTHAVCVNIPGHSPNWNWNGSTEAPTLSPSILCRYGANGKYVCHSFVENGSIRFLTDCTHVLAGQTVPLPQLPDWLR